MEYRERKHASFKPKPARKEICSKSADFTPVMLDAVYLATTYSLLSYSSEHYSRRIVSDYVE